MVRRVFTKNSNNKEQHDAAAPFSFRVLSLGTARGCGPIPPAPTHEQASKQTRKEAKQLQASEYNAVFALGEMRKAILVEVSTLEGTMRKLYDGVATVHKAVVCVHGLQQRSKEFVQTLKNIHASITHVQEWTMRYKGARLT